MIIRNITILVVIILFSKDVFSQQIIPYRKKNKWGYANNKGDVIIKPQYRVAKPFTTNITSVKKGRNYGFIDRTGKPVTKFEFTRTSDFYGGQATVWKKDTAYCIDKIGKRTRCMMFCGTTNSPLQHFATYIKSGKVGLINYAYFSETSKHDSLPAVWDKIIINDLYAAVKKENKWGVINTKGELVTTLIYDSIELNKNVNYRQFFRVKKNNKYGYLNEKGIEIVAPKYLKVGFFNSGIAKVWINDKFWFYIDQNGREYYKK